ncbi:MAG: DUF1592 domain-containing protein [bacterium]|nr:DUF1592 domain-containing protein [bacterium]
MIASQLRNLGRLCRPTALGLLVLALWGWSPWVVSPRLHAQQVLSFLDQYCIDCHAGGGAEAGIALDGFATEPDFLGSGKNLLRVLDVVQEGLMPPVDALQPEQRERVQFTTWIKDNLLSDQFFKDLPSPAVVIRRLNRQEYNNTLGDLLGLKMDFAEDFPPDDIGFGYDNIGSALNVSPVHVERYLNAAERATQSAIKAPDVESMPPVELIGLRTYPLPPDGVVEFEHHLQPGRYMADFSLVRAGISESVKPPRMFVSFGTDFRSIDAAKVQDETVVYRFWLSVFPGDGKVQVSLAEEQPMDELVVSTDSGDNVSGDKRYGNNVGLHVDSLVVRGPLPADAKSDPSFAKSWLVQPEAGELSRLECGRETVERFASAAFRRPASQEEVDRLMQIFRQAHFQGESYERAVQIAMTAVLVSPQFLYLVEPELAETDRQLTEFELASRLSYFLWSTMPDQELLAEASHGTLRSHLQQQVTRMLADDRSQAFVANFVGQWLQLRNLAGVAPDQEVFPEFSSQLAQDMRRETENFFAHVLRENQSVLQLLDSSFTFLNDSLARHYGIDDIEGDEFRRVDLPNRIRGGILTQASILTLTSHHNRTSPVKRGQWILQQLLGTPPPPPPPDVAALDESPEAAKTGSLRERLELHRSSPECASCHNQMDPLGFGLENFDAIGRYREMDGEFEIDASGVLPGGRGFEDVQELKQVLMSTASRRFTWCLIENMLTYGLGRSLEAQDYCTVEAIRRRLVENEFKIQQIVFAIVESDAFQRRGVSR